MDWLGSAWLKILELKMHLLVGTCAFCVFVLVLNDRGFSYAHNLSPDVLGLMLLGAILTFCLIVTQVGKQIFDLILAQRKRRADISNALEFQKGVYKFLDTLSAQEREVLSYLVIKNQQSFNADMMAKVVVTLQQKNLIAIGGGVMSQTDAPFIVPPFVWEELQRRKADFSKADLSGIHPWREHWMTR